MANSIEFAKNYTGILDEVGNVQFLAHFDSGIASR